MNQPDLVSMREEVHRLYLEAEEAHRRATDAETRFREAVYQVCGIVSVPVEDC